MPGAVIVEFLEGFFPQLICQILASRLVPYSRESVFLVLAVLSVKFQDNRAGYGDLRSDLAVHQKTSM